MNRELTLEEINKRVFYLKDNQIHADLLKNFLLSNIKKVKVNDKFISPAYVAEAYDLKREIMWGNGYRVVRLYNKEVINFRNLYQKGIKRLYTYYYVEEGRKKVDDNIKTMFTSIEEVELFIINQFQKNDLIYFTHPQAIVEHYINTIKPVEKDIEEVKKEAEKRVEKLIQLVKEPEPYKPTLWEKIKQFIQNYRS